jgi:hypothetical protein
MMKLTWKIARQHILLLVLLLSLASVMLLVADVSKPMRYDWLFLLPMTFAILSFYYRRVYDLPNIGCTVVLGQLFVRNVITPLAMRFGNYYSHFYETSGIHYQYAIYLMMYEMFFCFGAMKLALGRGYRGQRQTLSRVKRPRTRLYGVVILGLALTCVVLWVAFPVVQGNYWTIVDLLSSGLKDNPFTHFEHVNVGSIDRIGSTLFVFLFGFARILVPAYLIVKIHRRSRGSGVGLAFSLIIILAQLLFITSATAEALFAMMALFLFTTRLFGKYRKTLLGTMAIIVSLLVIFVFAMVYENELYGLGHQSFMEYVSWVLNSYFTGVDNVAATFDIIDAEKIRTFLFSAYETLPFRNTLFPMQGTSIVGLFTSLPGLGGQIVSTIGIGYHYLSFLFAPMLSCVSVYVSVLYGSKYKSTTNDWKSIIYLFTSFMLALSVGMYNIVIVLKMVMQIVLPMHMASIMMRGDLYDEPSKQKGVHN